MLSGLSGLGRCGMRSNIEVPVGFRRFRMHCTVPDVSGGLEVLQVREVPKVAGNRFLEPGSATRCFQSGGLGNQVFGV